MGKGSIAMKPKQIAKICVDLAMMIALLLLMTYEMIGQAAHEWVGMGMFLLFIIHHLLNLSWCKNLFHGRYHPYRAVQTGIVICILLTMFGSMISGIVLSQSVFDFLNINSGANIARSVHMLSAYWGFVLMGLHLGFHWNMFIKMAGKCFKNKSTVRTWILRGIAIVIALYGLYAFYLRGIGRYMFLIDHFVFFDFSEPIYWFVLDYIAIMGLMVAIGYCLSKGLITFRAKK